jgi:homopolymeric O-antigen transport system permease protein
MSAVHPVSGWANAPSRANQVWRFRELLRQLIIRNLKVKYQRSLLGFVWTFLNPLLTVGILVLVFSHAVRIPLVDYWAFVLSGYFVWDCVL